MTEPTKSEWEEELDDLERKTERGMYWVRLDRVRDIFTSHHNQLLDRVMEVMPPESDYTPEDWNPITGEATHKAWNQALSQCKESVKKLKI